MHVSLLSVGAGLLLSVWLAPASSGPSPSQIAAEQARCVQGCASEESKTDRTTCELVCETKAQNQREGGPKIQVWKKTKEMGGPPPEIPVGYEGDTSGTHTTVITTNADGTTTEKTHTHTQGSSERTIRKKTVVTGSGPHSTGSATPGARRARPARTAASRKAYSARVALASCQTRCNAQARATDRVTCKLSCLQRHKTPATVPAVHANPVPRRAKGVPRPKPTWATGASTSPSARPTSKGKAGPSPSEDATRQSCRNACESQMASCKSACSGSGSDTVTCELNCTETRRSCARKC